MSKKKVLIFGSGPAGLCCAERLYDKMDVTVVESGIELDTRTSTTAGLGGAGAFSDGKFIYEPCVGGKLHELVGYETMKLKIKEVDHLFMRHGAPEDCVKNSDYDESFKAATRAAGFTMRQSPVKHWGTDRGKEIVRSLYNLMKDNVDFQIGKEYYPDFYGSNYDYIILAVGRSGAWFMDQVYAKENLPFYPGATDIGVRYECRNDVFEEFYKKSYEHKLSLRSSFDEQVRAFCACLQNGYVAYEEYAHCGINCVNGHSYTDGHSGNANFAILVTVEFTHPFNDPNSYCKSICQTCNTLAGGGVLLQAYADIERKRRSTDKRIAETGITPSYSNAVAGDVTFALPYRHMSGIIEFVEALNKVFPGVKNGLMYAPEVKFYANRADIDKNSLAYKGLRNQKIFPAGDCSGWTRSLAQASAHGLLVADKILKIEGF